MDGPDPPNTAAPAHLDQEPETAGRRRRQLIESAALVGEMTAVLIADSRHLIAARSNNVIARPHMVVKTSADTAPAARQTIVCERCGLRIETPGVAIMRGRNVMHVRCDAHIGKGA